MLQNTLQEFWGANKFATSWIIGTNNPDKILQNIKDFAQDIINIKGLSIDNNPDFKIVERKDTKYIAVDQIRELQHFLYTTSTVGEYKFAVIYEAQLMNNNAANCCLKILEEPPRQSYLFLITSEPANLSATIKSRCHKLNIMDDKISSANISYIEFIKSLLDMDITQKIKLLQDVSHKAKIDNWDELCKNSIELLSNMVKCNSTANLIPEEMLYLKRYNAKNNNHELLKRLEKIQKLARDTSDFDLDKRHMGILILDSLVG